MVFGRPVALNSVEETDRGRQGVLITNQAPFKTDCFTTGVPTYCYLVLAHMTRVYTFGHSSRSIEEFISALHSYDISLLVDVRRFPGSQRNPQFNSDALAGELDQHGIGYRHLEALGGRRSYSLADSPNNAWENDSFQSYADYALTDAFQTALDELVALAEDDVPLIVCAETVYWRCHRRIIADWLIARGYDVVNIYDADRADDHELTRFVEIANERVTYPVDGS